MDRQRSGNRKMAIVVILTLATGSLFWSSLLMASDQPNFLIIMADDCTYNDLPVYGGANAQTPNIKQLASQG